MMPLWIAVAVLLAVLLVVAMVRRRRPPLSQRETAKLAGQKAMRGLQREARRRGGRPQKPGPGGGADGYSSGYSGESGGDSGGSSY